MTEPPESGRNSDQYPVGQRRTRIQSRVYDTLKRIPGTEEVRLEESGTGIGDQVAASVSTSIFADGVVPCDEAALQVNWWPQLEGDDWFQIHYADATGFDCGWHRQANDHVDGLDHFQWREDPDGEYDYHSVGFEANNPVGILWEIVDERLVERITDHYSG